MSKRIYILLLTCCLTLGMRAEEPVVQTTYSYRRFTTHDGLPQMQTEVIWQDSKGYIYIGTLSGFVRYDGKQLEPFLKGKRINIVGFAENSDGVTAFGFRRKWLIKGGKLSQTPLTDWGGQYNNFNSPSLPDDQLLLEDEQECNRQVCQFNGSSTKKIFSHPMLDKMTPDRKLFIDQDDIYIPTEEGLYLHHDGKLNKLTGKNDVFTLLRQKTHLYAFASDGVYVVSQGKLSPHVSYEFSAPDYGLLVCQDAGGRVFIADSHSLYLFDGQSVRLLSGGFNMIKDLFIDRWGRLWMATYQGVYLFYNTNFEIHRLNDEDDIVRSLCVDSMGHIVMGTLNGKVIAGGKVISNIDGNYYSPNAVLLSGKVYMPGNGDVMCVSGDTAEWLGLPKDRYQFVARHGEELVIGTRQALLSYSPQTGQTDTLTTDISHAWCATTDGDGRLWVGSTYGLYSIDKTASGMHAATVHPFGKERLTVTTMTRTPSGDIFVASCDSVFLVHDTLIENFTERIPMIQSHEIRSLHFSPRGYLIIAAIDGLLIAKTDDKYDVKQSRWFDHTNGFTSLEPLNALMCEEADGRIWLAGIDEVTTFIPERLLALDADDTIIIPPAPWWRTWWFIALSATTILLLIWWLLHNYEKRRVRRTLMRLEREKRQKDLLIQAIRLKSFPHFHANVMAGIEYMMMNNEKETGKYMKIYSDFTNQTLSDIDCTSRSIAEEVDYTLLYLQLEKLRYGDRLSYDVYVADNVNMQTQIPTMLIYTYVQNAVKHGIGNKPEGGRINVNITRQSNRIIVSVTDNGVGRDAAARLNRNSTRMGLRILLEQIELYNQANKEHILQTVTDLHDADGNATGTTFEMSIPEDYHYSIDSTRNR